MLNPELITKKIIGKTFVSQLYYFAEIDSTNNFAKQNNLPDNSLVITDYQFGGRGRFERKWESEKGKNLTFTIVKKIKLKHTEQAKLIYSISNSVYETLYYYLRTGKGLSKNLKVKWPNDILISGKKAAGILIETRGTTGIFVIGIGVNVNQQKFSESLKSTATSLHKELGKQIDLNAIFLKMIKRIEPGLHQLQHYKFNKIYTLWKKRVYNIGKKINLIDTKGNKIEGIIKDILPGGRLIIEQNGLIFSYNSSEIQLKNPNKIA